MSKELTHILTLAQHLSRAEQLRLIQAVTAIVEIHELEIDEDIEENWQVEIARRLSLYSGQMHGSPWRKVMEELRGGS